MSQLPSGSVCCYWTLHRWEETEATQKRRDGFSKGKRRVFVTPGGVVVALGRRIHSRMPWVRIGVNLFAKILPSMAMEFVKALCATENLTSPVDLTPVGVKEHDYGRLSKGATWQSEELEAAWRESGETVQNVKGGCVGPGIFDFGGIRGAG